MFYPGVPPTMRNTHGKLLKLPHHGPMSPQSLLIERQTKEPGTFSFTAFVWRLSVMTDFTSVDPKRCVRHAKLHLTFAKCVIAERERANFLCLEACSEG